MTKKTLGKEIYGGAADFGRVYALIGMVVGIVAGIAMMSGGIYFATLKDKHTAETQGKVVSIQDSACKNQQQQNHSAQCSYTIQYSVNGKVYTARDVFSSMSYIMGDSVTVYYTPSKPDSIELHQIPYTKIGVAVAAVGALILGGSVVRWYLARRYKFFAAAEGVAGGASVIRGVLR